jgi:Tol biopolymer transport system component
LVAALADRYRIERELGAGGMATVYLAKDLRHDRNVALKVLRPELAAVIGADRFLAEIKTTAALQHPHILPLFDSGQADGFLFYVMPLIEGESLRGRLDREKQLPVEDAIQLGKEIGSALDYAHRHGVIHRDIKPENILLHDGAALVADFGIALAVSHAGGNRMTETGLSLGTPGTIPTLPAITAAMPVAAARDQRLTLALAGAGVLLAGLAAWGWLRPSPRPYLNRYVMHLREYEALATGVLGGHIAISPDGRRIVFTGRGEGTNRLWIKDADQIAPTPLAGTEGVLSPFFSPDGRNLGFVKDGRTIRLMPLDGGSPTTLTDSANATAADWGTDGNIYFEVDSGISRMPAGGGRSEPVFRFASAPGKHPLGAEWPVVLPGMKGVLFRLRREGQAPAEYEIMVQPLPKGEPRVLLRGMYARYVSTGHLVVVTVDGKLLVVPFDLGRLAITGPAAALYDGLESNPFTSAIGLSATGTLVYQTASQASSREVVWVTREGVATRADSTWTADGTINALALSPNGRQVAVEVLKGAKSDIWVKQLPTGPFSRITFGDTSFTRPSWMPDGSQVLYLGDRGDGGGLPFLRRADGVGPATRPVLPPFASAEVRYSPDGRWIVLRRVAADVGNGDVFGMKPGDTTVVPFVNSPGANEITPAVSPDGRWLAYASNESGTHEVYVRPFPDVASARWQVSSAGGTAPLWAHSGKELFFRNNRGDLVAAEIRTTSTFSVGRQQSLFPLTPYSFGGPVPLYAVGLDDRRFLMMRATTAGDAGLLIINEHWTDALKARERK